MIALELRLDYRVIGHWTENSDPMVTAITYELSRFRHTAGSAAAEPGKVESQVSSR